MFAIITGANSGMGKAATAALADRGYEVIMLCRNEKRGREAYEFLKQERPERNIELMLCDLGNLRSIRSFVLALKNGHQTIDVLINNAGFISLDRQLTDDGFERQFGINHLGHFALTEQLIPFMKSVR